MVRTAIAHTCRVVSILALMVPVGSAWANPDTLQPPAGPIAGTYKTLTEVEPRTIVNARNTPGNVTATFIISQPGSYYLDRNITGESGKVGIRIVANDVTLDLNGFVLQGVTGATSGIVYSGSDRFRLRNGTVRGWPGAGVTFASGVGFNNIVEDLQVSENVGAGLDLRDGVQVRRVKVEFNSGLGVRLASGSSIADSTIRALAGGGVGLLDGSSARNCFVDAGPGTGLIVSGTNCTVRDNVVVVNSANGRGVSIAGSNSVVESNTITGQNSASTQGVFVTAGVTGLTFRNNVVKGTADNYVLISGASNQYELLLSQIPETIDVVASVRLTGSLTLPTGSTSFGVRIASDNVTFDLAGHALIGVATSGNGIELGSGARLVSIRNGTVRGFNAGVVINDAGAANGSDASIEDLRVSNNRREGIMGGPGTRISRCSVLQNASTGSVSAIIVGDGCDVSNCSVVGNGGAGIDSSGAGSTIRANTVVSNSGAGVLARGPGCLIESNTVRINQLEGILLASTSCTARNNVVDFNGRAAGNQANIGALAGSNLIEGNHCTAADIGIQTAGAGNRVIRNTCGQHGAGNYSLGAGAVYGPIVVIGGAGADLSAVANGNHPAVNLSLP